LSRPSPSRSFTTSNFHTRVNGKIRAREVRVIGTDMHQLGVFSLNEALAMARSQRVDLVEIAANAKPPVCRLVDYGKFRYEQSKRDKEARRHQHANKVKEVQLSPTIDPHDFGVKLEHAVGFLCEEMKVKITLRFRGREMAHQEYGFQVVTRFMKEVAPYGHPDAPPRLIGRGINVMLSPLPRAKRGKPPKESEHPTDFTDDATVPHPGPKSAPVGENNHPPSNLAPPPAAPSQSFGNNPFAGLKIEATSGSGAESTSGH
jgi:translation initiation factor IF-3